MPETNLDFEEKLHKVASRLRFPTFLQYRDIIKPNASFAENLCLIGDLEIQRRLDEHLRRRVQAADFPIVKTIDTFELSSEYLPYVNLNLVREELFSCEFLRRKEDIILIGPSGRGKSHFATAIGYEAAKQGYKVLFRRADTLIAELVEAKSEQSMLNYESKLNKLDLLIIDEFGYSLYNSNEASLLSKVIVARHESKSTIVVANDEFNKWRSFITNKTLCNRVISKLTFRSAILNMNGDKDYRYINSKALKFLVESNNDA
ncbi:MAG: ATP-binding protein [Rickettsiales bacterium]|jgi:DNA replication protein DnaC|nr:ATP-binding protein [Rickettsiales bacterium]